MNFNIEEIFNQFDIIGTYENNRTLISGLINDTIYIQTKEIDAPNYILQRINHHIFKHIPELQDNILRVTNHIYYKLLILNTSDIKRKVLTLIKTKKGLLFYEDKDGNYWRVILFIENSKVYEKLDSVKLAYEGGLAFGNFNALLADLPGEPLFETIPNFHNMESRLETFFNAVKNNFSGRVNETLKEIKWVEERADNMCRLNRLFREGKLPKRITHCDTKLSNILFNENDTPLCIIDLDTVMPGFLMSDFGDAIRGGTNTGLEDDANLNNVSMNISLFEGYANGYIKSTSSILNSYEIENLAFGAKHITFMQSIRFLSDYLDGDKYYKIHFPNQNLQRTRAQFKLLFSMEAQWDEMQKIVDRAANFQSK